MDLDVLRTKAGIRAGWQCEWPKCSNAYEQMAHLRHRGMGGSESANVPSNVAMLCTYHHDLLDGRTTHGRKVEVSVLLAHYLNDLDAHRGVEVADRRLR